jgi:hypothetical protein
MPPEMPPEMPTQLPVAMNEAICGWVPGGLSASTVLLQVRV